MQRQLPRPAWPLDCYRDRRAGRSWADRAELNALFALRHPRAARATLAPITRQIVRRSPPIILLATDTPGLPPGAIDARFCRPFGSIGPPFGGVLACLKRPRRPAG